MTQAQTPIARKGKTVERLTDLACRNAGKGLVAQVRIPDGGKLYLQVTPGRKGLSKRWVFRTQGGSWLPLGPYPEISLADAREMALEQRKLEARGTDPIKEKRRLEAEKEQETEAAAKKAKAEAKAALTFDQAVVRYIEVHGPEWSNAKHAAQWETTLRDYASPVIVTGDDEPERTFGNTPVCDIDRDMVLKVLRPHWATKTETMVRVRGRIAQVINWAVAEKHRPPGPNPATWQGDLEHSLAKPGKITKVRSHAALDYEEIGAFMRELRKLRFVGARPLEFLVLCASRSDEVRLAQWKEIDLGRRLWTVPARRMKGRIEHQVPLSDAAVAVLLAVKGTGAPDPDDYVFTGRFPGKAIDESSMLGVAKRLTKHTDSKTVVHGLRSTFRDWAGDEEDTADEVAERALAHTIKSKSEKPYRRRTAIAKRRDLMEAWARFCAGENPAANNVTPLRVVA
jgi:integrase